MCIISLTVGHDVKPLLRMGAVIMVYITQLILPWPITIISENISTTRGTQYCYHQAWKAYATKRCEAMSKSAALSANHTLFFIVRGFEWCLGNQITTMKFNMFLDLSPRVVWPKIIAKLVKTWGYSWPLDLYIMRVCVYVCVCLCGEGYILACDWFYTNPWFYKVCKRFD